MPNINRREFLDRCPKTGLGWAAGLTILADAGSVRAAPANDKITLAMIGVRGRGPMLAHGFLDRGDCEISYVCDVNSKLFESRAKDFAERQGGRRPVCLQDFRKALEDESLDAVVIATPDHWHALATIWSCQAGKDVYVEKPISHNGWEGRKMVEAARKYKRIVQAGTQNRSAPYNFAAKKYIEEGKLGRIHMFRVYQHTGSNRNFEMAEDSDPPEGLDWDMWNGPAPKRNFNSTIFRNKAQFWDYGAGSIVGDGTHQLDLARWLCGVDYPKSVYSTGGRFDTTGAAQTPDTQVVVYQFDNMVATMEYTAFTPYMLKTPGDIRQSDLFPYWPQNSTRIEIFGTEGVMFVGRHGGGWQVFERPQDRKPVVAAQMFGRHPDPDHKEDFIRSIRSRQRPNADIEEAQRSVLLSHYGTISYRLGGQKLQIDPKTEQVIDNPEAMKLFKRAGRQPWLIPEVV